MQAVIGDDPFDAALADGMILLADFLSDDGRGRIWIEEPAADDQAHDLIGAAVLRFRTPRLEEQALGALLAEIGQDLIIALAGEVIFLSGVGRAETFALAVDEHGEAATDLVIVRNAESASGTGETELFLGERNLHGRRIQRLGS